MKNYKKCLNNLEKKMEKTLKVSFRIKHLSVKTDKRVRVHWVSFNCGHYG